MQDYIAIQPDTAVICCWRHDGHQHYITVLRAVYLYKTCLGKVLHVQVHTVRPPVIWPVEVRQLDGKHLPVVVADERVAVDCAVVECSAQQRQLASGRHLHNVRLAVLAVRKPDDRPVQAVGAVRHHVGRSRLAIHIWVRVNDRHHITEGVGRQIILRQNQKFLPSIASRVPAWHILSPLADGYDQAA